MTLIESVFTTILLAALLLLMLFAFYILTKNEVTCRNRNLIIDAIYHYHKECLEKRELNKINDATYSDMETYEETLYRIWDWGYTRILPPEKYEIIKPYIKK